MRRLRRLRPFVFLGILIVAFLQLAGVLYYIDQRTLRLFFGLLLLVPIVWVLTRPNFFQAIQVLPAIRERKYVKMRMQVELVLAEVRRLNGIAVDADRGFRSHAEADREMDIIEQNLVAIISKVRQTAGRTSDEVDVEPVPAGTMENDT